MEVNGDNQWTTMRSPISDPEGHTPRNPVILQPFCFCNMHAASPRVLPEQATALSPTPF
jgi:hypothetical protein